ncbi:MAG: isochorismatase family cysteine hydrolase [Candidatus Acidiferrales bacterium]|jgi:nicotinamidase/pyrazinamidase
MRSQSVVFWEVDAQADFMLPGGALYVPGAEKTLPNLKRLVDAARSGHVFLVSSVCHHSTGDPEFKIFPPHCIRDTPGARIVSEGLAENFLRVPNGPKFEWPRDLDVCQQVVFEKQKLDVFTNPQADVLVERLGDVRYVMFGVVTEYCVGLAAKGLLKRGHRVSLVKDAIETLNQKAGNGTLDELKALGADLITTDEALALVA